MKFSPHLRTLSLLLLIAWITDAPAQSMDDSSAEAAPPGSTVITSDELRSDQTSHTAVFSGNVVVVGSNFNMKCQEMTVIFTTDNKVDHIVATGNVVIEQPGRITHSGQAEYFHDEDKFVLTDQPTILDNKNQISAVKITIFRMKQQMVAEGRPRTVLIQDINSGATTPATPSTDDK